MGSFGVCFVQLTSARGDGCEVETDGSNSGGTVRINHPADRVGIAGVRCGYFPLQAGSFVPDPAVRAVAAGGNGRRGAADEHTGHPWNCDAFPQWP